MRFYDCAFRIGLGLSLQIQKLEILSSLQQVLMFKILLASLPLLNSPTEHVMSNIRLRGIFGFKRLRIDGLLIDMLFE